VRTRHLAFALAVSALFLTAGCAGPLVGDSDPNPDAGELTADDVTDTSVLIQTHTETLRANTFTVRATTTIEDPGRTFRVVNERTWRVDPKPPIRAWTTSRWTTSGDAPERYERGPDRTSAWRQGNTTTVRVRTGNETRTRSTGLLNTSVRLNSALHRQSLSRFSERQNTTVEEVTQDGTRLYRVHADLKETRVSSNASMTLFVSPTGYVHRIETTRTVEYRSGPRVVTSTVRFTQVGETTVASPGWTEQ